MKIEEFKEAWDEHITELYRLKLSLPKENWEELEKNIFCLRTLVRTAVSTEIIRIARETRYNPKIEEKEVAGTHSLP